MKNLPKAFLVIVLSITATVLAVSTIQAAWRSGRTEIFYSIAACIDGLTIEVGATGQEGKMDVPVATTERVKSLENNQVILSGLAFSVIPLSGSPTMTITDPVSNDEVGFWSYGIYTKTWDTGPLPKGTRIELINPNFTPDFPPTSTSTIETIVGDCSISNPPVDSVSAVFAQQPSKPLNLSPTTTFTIPVDFFEATRTIADVNVGMWIENVEPEKLEVALISPEGTKVQLLDKINSPQFGSRGADEGENSPGAVYDKMPDFVLDDDSAFDFVVSTSPYTTTAIRPNDLLSAFNRRLPNGDWTLVITNTSVISPGLLKEWALDISVKIPTTTTLTSVPNPSVDGQLVEFKATVTGQGGTPTGNVTFFEGTTMLGTIPLSNGVATLPKNDLSVGAHSITATYSGDATFNASTTSLTHTVNAPSKVNTTTALTSAPNPSVVGQLVEFEATVTGQGGTPTGNVTFSVDGALLDVPLSNGVAILPNNDLLAGAHSITATYSGDATFNASTTSLTHTVTPEPNVYNVYLPVVVNDAGGVPSATELFSGQSVSGQVGPNNLIASYTIYAEANQLISIVLSGVGGDAYLSLYTPSGEGAGDAYASPSSDGSIVETLWETGYWDIEVYASSGTFDYQLTVDLVTLDNVSSAGITADDQTVEDGETSHGTFSTNREGSNSKQRR